MCDHCITESVKSRMLNRRDLFRASAAIGAAGALGAVAAPEPSLAQPIAAARMNDLTHELHEHFPTFFGDQRFFIDKPTTYAKNRRNSFTWRIAEHIGTHIDAPLHFSEDGMSVGEVPVEDLICPLVIVDIRAKAAENPDAQLTPDDLRAWTSSHGPVPDGACVAMLSGWSQHVRTEKFRNADDKNVLHFPGFHVEAVRMLLEETSAKGLAVDTLSTDYGPAKEFAVHYEWLPTGRWNLECVANLEALPPKGAMLIVGAPKVIGGSGGPARVFALA